MIVEVKKQHQIKDLLSACAEQSDLIHRIIIEVEPSFERSKLKALLKSDRWPLAVNPHLIVNNDSYDDKLSRGETILDTFVENGLVNKKFLDFGCGEGHVAKAGSERATFSVGYDIDDSGWEAFHESDRFMLTNDWQAVINKGPYDVVFLYDVLDHIDSEDPIDVLKMIYDVLVPKGRIYVRCHPWCSRTSTHVYRNLNKAFVHMFFNEEELREMGCEPLPIRKILHPIVTYDDWFQKSGFKKVDEKVLRQDVEPFFLKEELLSSLVKKHYKDSFEERYASGREFPKFQVEQNFLDFTLEKS